MDEATPKVFADAQKNRREHEDIFKQSCRILKQILKNFFNSINLSLEVTNSK